MKIVDNSPKAMSSIKQESIKKIEDKSEDTISSDESNFAINVQPKYTIQDDVGQLRRKYVIKEYQGTGFTIPKNYHKKKKREILNFASLANNLL